jgi:23S rRNA pseudouridine1911/1915/1917 synthase
LKTLRLEVQEEAVRIDLALLAELQKEAPHLSRASLKTWFKNDHVLLQGRPISGSHLLRAGSYEVTVLRWDENSRTPPQALASDEGSFLPIVYEDDEILIFNKLTGVPSVPQDSQESRTAVGAALAHLPSLRDVGRGGFEPAILHRLDTGTSGLIVFAKTAAEFDRLRTLWKSGHVKKTYRALSRGAGPESESARPKLPLRIDDPLAHDAKSAKRMVALKGKGSSWPSLPERRPEIRGEPLAAVTHLLEFNEVSNGLYDMKIEIDTGVMHQIRCHLASIGWPLLGDSVYKGVPSARLWLHAWLLEIPLTGGAVLRLEASMPTGWPTKK